jgi:hypothetical protein
MPKRKVQPKPKPEYRIRVIEDSDYTPDGCDGKPLPEAEATYTANPVMVLINPADDPTTGKRRKKTYAEYLKYDGNPERHIGLAVLLDRRCPCCGEWKDGVQALWGIDFMDDSPEYLKTSLSKPYAVSELANVPGYLAEVARELLQEEGVQL